MGLGTERRDRETNLTNHPEVKYSERVTGISHELFRCPEGLGPEHVRFHLDTETQLSGSPDLVYLAPPEFRSALTEAYQRTKDIREPKGDFNGPKVSLNRLLVENKQLVVDSSLTDYFTLWGLPGVSPELHERYLKELNGNRETMVPNGIGTHDIVITSDDAILMVRSRAQGFHAGRISLSFEEQMDAETDPDIHSAAQRGIQEELAIEVPANKIKLLGAAAEAGLNYTNFCFVTRVDKTREELIELWKRAPDHNEASALFAVQLEDLTSWPMEGVPEDIWKPYDSEKRIAPGTTLQFHPTVDWRINLLNQYLKLNR